MCVRINYTLKVRSCLIIGNKNITKTSAFLCSVSIYKVVSKTDKLTHCPAACTINQETKCGHNEYPVNL